MQFDIITIFPEIFESFLDESIIKRSRKKGLIKIKIHNLRNFTQAPHHTVDDRPFGGGRGMVMKIEPIYRAVQKVKLAKKMSTRKRKIILFSPRGKTFTQKKAYSLSRFEQLILICGRYEGIDERVAKFTAHETLSIGNFVLMGGEVAAIAVIEAVARLIPGVLGKPQLLEQRIAKDKGFLEYPQYTRPEIFEPKRGMRWKVPQVLLSGNHEKIQEWRKEHSKVIR